MNPTELAELDAVDLDPVTVSWRGYARTRIHEYNADFQNPESAVFCRTLERQKTNLVVETLAEAYVVVWELDGYDSSGRVWMTAAQDRSLARIRTTIVDALAEQGYAAVYRTSNNGFPPRFRGFVPADAYETDDRGRVLTDPGDGTLMLDHYAPDVDSNTDLREQADVDPDDVASDDRVQVLTVDGPAWGHVTNTRADDLTVKLDSGNRLATTYENLLAVERLVTDGGTDTDDPSLAPHDVVTVNLTGTTDGPRVTGVVRRVDEQVVTVRYHDAFSFDDGPLDERAVYANGPHLLATPDRVQRRYRLDSDDLDGLGADVQFDLDPYAPDTEFGPRAHIEAARTFHTDDLSSVPNGVTVEVSYTPTQRGDRIHATTGDVTKNSGFCLDVLTENTDQYGERTTRRVRNTGRVTVESLEQTRRLSDSGSETRIRLVDVDLPGVSFTRRHDRHEELRAERERLERDTTEATDETTDEATA